MTEIAHTTSETTIRVMGTQGTPDVLLTLPVADYDGSPVEIKLSIAYANFIPDGSANCGLWFLLYDGSSPLSMIGFYGAHSSTMNRQAPFEVSDVLEDDRAPEGSHVFSVRVWKWAPQQDSYIAAGDGVSGHPKPMRLSARYL